MIRRGHQRDRDTQGDAVRRAAAVGGLPAGDARVRNRPRRRWCCCAARPAALGFTWSGYACNALDIAPRHSTWLVGFSNTIATIPGIVGVAITGWLVDVTGTYSAPFVLTASIAVLGAFVYTVFFNAQPLFPEEGT